MVAYELYCFDEITGYEFIGTLPERRKNPERITRESIIQWGRAVLGDKAEGKSIFFKQVTLDKNTGRIYWVNF